MDTTLMWTIAAAMILYQVFKWVVEVALLLISMYRRRQYLEKVRSEMEEMFLVPVQDGDDVVVQEKPIRGQGRLIWLNPNWKKDLDA